MPQSILFHQELLKSIDYSVIILDESYNLVSENRAALELTNLDKSYKSHSIISELVADRDHLTAVCNRLSNSLLATTYAEMDFLHADGSRIPMSLRISAIAIAGTIRSDLFSSAARLSKQKNFLSIWHFGTRKRSIDAPHTRFHERRNGRTAFYRTGYG